MRSQSALVGSWRKVSTLPCGAAYPSELVFKENGSYVGRGSSAGVYTHWDVGTFREAGLGRIELSTANDAIVSYGLSIEQDHVSFVDPQGCEVRYRRSD